MESKKVYIGYCEISQSNYSESRYWTFAQPAVEIAGVFSTKEAAWDAAKELEAEIQTDYDGIVTALVLEMELDKGTGCFVPSM